MKRALALAKRGLGQTQPNPLVGAIVLDAHGKLAGTGFHPKAGEPHAEVLALNEAGSRSKGGTLYLTLEPCTHQGRTPPCAPRVIQSGIQRAVVAQLDPNPAVNGAGIQSLRNAGIGVDIGVCEAIADQLLFPFRVWITKNRPVITAKAAVSVDGKIGVVGKRIQLSGPASERTTMKLRAEAGAIVVGVTTIVSDDPLLTVRGKFQDRKPIRAVVDGNLRTPPMARLFSTDGGPIWIFCREETLTTSLGKEKEKILKEKGAQIVPLPQDRDGLLVLKDVIEKLADQGINAILVEGGGRLFSHFVSSGWIDRWVIYLTPTVLGMNYEGEGTIPFPLTSPDLGPFPLNFQSVIRRGADMEIVAYSQNL